MKAIKLPETILNADLITSCLLRGKAIRVYYTNGSSTELVYSDEEKAKNVLEYIYQQLKEQEQMEKCNNYWSTLTQEQQDRLLNKFYDIAVEICLDEHKKAWKNYLEKRRTQSRPLNHKNVTDDEYQAVFAGGMIEGCACGIASSFVSMAEEGKIELIKKGGNNG